MESTLARPKSDLEERLAVIAGYGSRERWKDDVQTLGIIVDCVKSGYSRFLNCGYAWSFLKPWAELTLLKHARTVPLPDDFGGFEGEITVTNSSGSGTFPTLKIQTDQMVENRRSVFPDDTGSPQMIAMRATKGTTPNRSSRAELHVWPAADDTYTLKGQYYLVADALDDSHPNAYGGPEHSETILQSCLAIYEERYRFIANGPAAQAFSKLMQQSIMLDSRKKPQYLGQTKDKSDSVYTIKTQTRPDITVDGVVMGE